MPDLKKQRYLVATPGPRGKRRVLGPYADEDVFAIARGHATLRAEVGEKAQLYDVLATSPGNAVYQVERQMLADKEAAA
jgi:hypothetical protein